MPLLGASFNVAAMPGKALVIHKRGEMQKGKRVPAA